MMVESSASRRRFLKDSAGAAVVAAAPAILSSRARAQRKTLKISQWKHFVPAFDDWFSGSYVKEWGEQNDTEVIVDYVAARRHRQAGREAEVAAGPRARSVHLSGAARRVRRSGDRSS